LFSCFFLAQVSFVVPPVAFLNSQALRLGWLSSASLLLTVPWLPLSNDDAALSSWLNLFASPSATVSL
jgi:hypothetical protein